MDDQEQELDDFFSDWNEEEFQYNQLLYDWDKRFYNSWWSDRRYWSDEKRETEKNKDFSVLSETAQRIYIALNTEKERSPYWEMLGYLSKRSAKELLEAEKLVPEFMAFLQKSDMTPEQQLKLKTVFPHIAGSYVTLTSENDKKISFTEFLKPMNGILQKLKKGDAYYSPTMIFDKYMSDYYNCYLDKTRLAMNLTLLKEASKQTSSCKILQGIEDDFSAYARVFPETVNARFLANYVQHIIPRSLHKDDIFGAQSNKWGCGRGKGIAKGVGAATYAYKCYATDITPRGVNDLVQMSYETLAGDFKNFESIRKDALLLNSWFPRDPIHDSAPGVNDILTKMVAYYDAAPKDKEAALSDLKKASEKMPFWGDKIYHLDKYDEINPRSNEKNIDILRRINRDMSQNNNEAPLTENARLNELAQKVGQREAPFMFDVMPLVVAVNKEILSAMDKKQTGFSPEMVNLIAWTDRKLAQSLNDMDFERQMGFYKSDDCKEVLKFSELVHSPKEKFDAKEFEDFYQNKVKNAFDMEEAYQNIAQRQNENLFALYRQYDKDCHAMDDSDGAKVMTEARKERAGSGNTLKSLQNMTLYKEPSTKIGMREKQERENRSPYRAVMLKEFYKVNNRDK